MSNTRTNKELDFSHDSIRPKHEPYHREQLDVSRLVDEEEEEMGPENIKWMSDSELLDLAYSYDDLAVLERPALLEVISEFARRYEDRQDWNRIDEDEFSLDDLED